MLEVGFSTEMSEWVSLTVGAQIAGKSYTTLYLNIQKGRIPFRVKERHCFVYKSWIAGFQGAPMGNPDRIRNSDTHLKGGTKRTFERIRTATESSHDDVVYDFTYTKEEILVTVTVILDDAKSTPKIFDLLTGEDRLKSQRKQ
jgi:hypothetical protein